MVHQMEEARGPSKSHKATIKRTMGDNPEYNNIGIVAVVLATFSLPVVVLLLYLPLCLRRIFRRTTAEQEEDSIGGETTCTNKTKNSLDDGIEC